MIHWRKPHRAPTMIEGVYRPPEEYPHRMSWLGVFAWIVVAMFGIWAFIQIVLWSIYFIGTWMMGGTS